MLLMTGCPQLPWGLGLKPCQPWEKLQLGALLSSWTAPLLWLQRGQGLSGVPQGLAGHARPPEHIWRDATMRLHALGTCPALCMAKVQQRAGEIMYPVLGSSGGVESSVNLRAGTAACPSDLPDLAPPAGATRASPHMAPATLA